MNVNFGVDPCFGVREGGLWEMEVE